jgi:hypothetical protein
MITAPDDDLTIPPSLDRRHEAPGHVCAQCQGWPDGMEDLRDPKLHLDGPDAIADFHAIEAHLDKGRPLFDGLRKANGDGS